MNRSKRRIKNKKSKKASKTGGMFSHKPANEQKSKTNLSHKTLSTLPGGVDPELRLSALAGPNSGHVEYMMRHLGLTNPVHTVSRRVAEMSRDTMTSVLNQRLANSVRESAQRLRAGSFRSRDLAQCARTNAAVVEQLKRSIALGSLSACADLADMLFHGDTVGVAQNDDAAVDLVAAIDHLNPDCEGIVALWHYHHRHVHEARELAEHSAAAGSKYGQFALGLLENMRGNFPVAVAQLQLAAAQNYDEAQLKLSEMYHRGDGVVRDFNEAMRLCHLAADQGNHKAFVYVGRMHRDAIREKVSADPEKDLADAFHWGAIAQAAGNGNADKFLSKLRKDVNYD